MSINSYNIYRIDRIGSGGRVAIYFEIYFNVSILSTITVPKCFIVHKIEGAFNNTIVVVGIHRPPSAESCSIA